MGLNKLDQFNIEEFETVEGEKEDDAEKRLAKLFDKTKFMLTLSYQIKEEIETHLEGKDHVNEMINAGSFDWVML